MRISLLSAFITTIAFTNLAIGAQIKNLNEKTLEILTEENKGFAKDLILKMNQLILTCESGDWRNIETPALTSRECESHGLFFRWERMKSPSETNYYVSDYKGQIIQMNTEADGRLALLMAKPQTLELLKTRVGIPAKYSALYMNSETGTFLSVIFQILGGKKIEDTSSIVVTYEDCQCTFQKKSSRISCQILFN